ncbi:5-methylcytosine-specific restriction endonuclease system specificity protein McrC [Nesterenkonia sp. E16_7]|uniref:5-methylcytosine-specific restriction endonuclease system specificity protein McrC n=1 Tax=unclassified Nesterenkonia TaxID=2629769 RepID=UPI001A938D54|nr:MULTISPECIES: 5-methylcytosine-specific restriction endonuclease system specificity protein McrC [unclassified Nesterenkonia]MBO0594951.1 5-methylcytosine-specific restriction endonuclease system specificity protein McrC [Nesterenkonia sp. E16_10]MBO0598606.1 5-methylcytosine-specific restriction endonuclease system specificity protein McrC [Nesterenkonia sp. E16_7]
MTARTIAIRNVYVMMAYAFRGLRNVGNDRVATESFEHLHDLFAEMLIRGVGTQVKRGLHRDYLLHREELATVRSRIDITRTVATRSTLRGKLVCEFDEYDPDTPHNQALKSVIVLLIRHGDVYSARKDALRRLLPYLDAVTLVAPTSIRWDALTYHRANAPYRMLLGVCELVVRGLLPTQDAGTSKLTSWVSDEVMSSLFERFLLEYFKVHYPDLSPNASTIAWDYDYASALGAAQLPAMRTDVTLLRGGHTLIIDAKYYSKSMQTGRWGKATVHSANLYQLVTYVKNADVDRDGSVSGLLLYARTEAPRQPDLDVVVQGSRIGARTLDLGQPWEQLTAQLEDIVRMVAN